MLSQVENCTETTDEGNTILHPHKELRHCRWCGTLNNYTEQEYIHIIETFNKRKYKWIVGKEGKNKTPHLQIYIESKNAIRLQSLKRINDRAHWEKAIASKDDNVRYCSKEGDYKIKGLENFIDVVKQECLSKYKKVKWRLWQERVLESLKFEPDDRTIHWYYDKEGSTGKSFLCKYLDLVYDVIIGDGKKENVFNQIKNYMDNEKIPKIIILDIPRHNIDYINYGTLELIKNGHIYSGKYEGGKCIFPSPHVFVFANCEPDRSKLSTDRWNIVDIDHLSKPWNIRLDLETDESDIDNSVCDE